MNVFLGVAIWVIFFAAVFIVGALWQEKQTSKEKEDSDE